MVSSSRLCLLSFILVAMLTIQSTIAESSDSDSSQLADHESHDRESSDPPIPSDSGENHEDSGEVESAAEAPSNRRMGKHGSDKSVAGGGVIIGGLVTAIFAAVFCYIRVTRKRNNDVSL